MRSPEEYLFKAAPAIIPDHPKWGLYLYLEDVDDSLVEAHVSVRQAQSGESTAVLWFEELRTPESKALTAALAIAAAELLGTEIQDLEHVWSSRDQVAPDELERQLTIPMGPLDVEAAAMQLQRKMNRS